jgi:hypothetical protein
MLRQQPPSVLAPLQLIADPGRDETVTPVHRAKALIPPREQDAKVNPLRPTFMAHTNPVMAPMKLRSNDEISEQPGQTQSQIGMLPLLNDTRCND